MTYKLLEKVVEKTGEVVIPYSKYLLSNGLTVIIHQDHSTPLVHVDVTYHVGSGREEVGKSGFAHFFEHMMFEGSKNVANNLHFKYISEAGGTLNGSTNRDRTNYYETLPKNQLELALWLESDRMGFLLDAVTQEGFENQRSVIKNEKSQRYENQPYGMLSQITQENFYPENHPYSWTTIGYTEDLDRVTTDDLKEFFATWYGPNNAVLTIGGDVKEEETIKLVEQYFGSIPRGPEVLKPEYDAVSLTDSKYVSYKDKVRFPMLQITLPTVPAYHKDEPALDILSDILGNGKSSHLYKAFVKSQKAVQVYASNYCYEGSGEFRLGVFAYPNQSLAEVEKEIQSIINDIATNGISAVDVERARVKYYSQILYSLESVKNKVSRLAAYHTFAPTANYAATDVDRYKNVGVDDVIRVFNKYVLNKPSVNISFVDEAHLSLIPRTDTHSFKRVGLESISHAKEIKAPVINDGFDRSVKPEGGQVPVVEIPDLYRKDFANGTTLLGAFNDKSPTLSLKLNFRAGSITDPDGQSGRASFYSRIFKESTKNQTAVSISKKLESMGSRISADATKENFVIDLKCLKENAEETFVLLEELLFRQHIDTKEFERNVKEHKEFLAYQQDEVDVLANRAFFGGIYGANHLLGRPTSGRLHDADNISIGSLLAFKEQYLNPENCQIVCSGSATQKEIEALLGFVSKWPKANTQLPIIDSGNYTSGGKILIRHKEGAPQSEIRIGYPSMSYNATGQFYKASIMNYPLGAAFNSRINLNLREDKGYTYGARSYFHGGRYQGPFVASAAVAANVTAQAVKEFMFEIANYREKGIGEEELAFTKKSLLYREALKYETNGQKNQFMLKMLEFGLVKEYVQEQKLILANIASSEINELAKKWLPIEQMVIVVAGDKNVIKEPLEALGLGEVIVLEEDPVNV